MRTKSFLSGLAMLWAVSANAQTYSCDAAKNQAKVGVRPGNEVAVTMDYRHQECRFSVNGTPVGSPPLATILAGLGQLIDGSMVKQLQSGDVRSLALVLLSAARETEPPADLVATLGREAKSLARCVEDFLGNKLGPGQFMVRSDSVICGLLPADSINVKPGVGSGVTVAPSGEAPRGGILAIAVARKEAGIDHFLFVPRSYVPR
jgi:hypothetical protein